MRGSGSAALVGAVVPDRLAKIDLIFVRHRTRGTTDASPNQCTGDCANATECQAGEGASAGADAGAAGRAVNFRGSTPRQGNGRDSENQDEIMFFHLLIPSRC
jgi:hypothetical protein